MDDRELLELAAKAGDVKLWRGNARRGSSLLLSCGRALWNPLKNKADTLELEIKLKLDVAYLDDVDMWRVSKVHDGFDIVRYDKDRQRATTLCAAEIGRTL